MKKLIPIILPVLGTAIGIGAWAFLHGRTTEPSPTEAHASNTGNGPASDHESADAKQSSYVKLNNQFIVPVIDKGKVSAIIVLSLSLEISDDNAERVYSMEPKLRDAFLQVLFDHSNIGGFHGAFTDASKIAILRRSLLAIAQKTLGDQATDVLITNLARQDA